MRLPQIDPEKGSWDEESLDRRQFLQTGFWGITGAAVLIVSGVSLRFLVGQSFQSSQEQWVEVGQISELPPGNMHRITYVIRAKDLWRETERKGLLYAFSDDGSAYTVLDSTCSHLGCNVRWSESQAIFACPCHKGHFTRQGEVITGPPPTALRQLTTKIENGILWAFV